MLDWLLKPAMETVHRSEQDHKRRLDPQMTRMTQMSRDLNRGLLGSAGRAPAWFEFEAFCLCIFASWDLPMDELPALG